MMLDPTLVTLAALVMAVSWTMTFAGLKKHMLEPRTRKRTCPSCGRAISGRVCTSH
jgi:hypothetical protein